MNAVKLEAILQSMSALAGMAGCAMVDAETGMAWKTAGTEDIQVLCEAASDYWRLHTRTGGHYAPLVGELAAQVLIHTRGRITIVGCGGTLLNVCVSREPDGVDWARWKVLVGDLRKLAAST
jgi:hypothetical protein